MLKIERLPIKMLFADFGFLLRFLRVRKFSQLAARETLENYWTIKMKRPDWHKDIDPCEPDMQEILRAR